MRVYSHDVICPRYNYLAICNRLHKSDHGTREHSHTHTTTCTHTIRPTRKVMCRRWTNQTFSRSMMVREQGCTSIMHMTYNYVFLVTQPLLTLHGFSPHSLSTASLLSISLLHFYQALLAPALHLKDLFIFINGMQ